MQVKRSLNLVRVDSSTRIKTTSQTFIGKLALRVARRKTLGTTCHRLLGGRGFCSMHVLSGRRRTLVTVTQRQKQGIWENKATKKMLSEVSLSQLFASCFKTVFPVGSRLCLVGRHSRRRSSRMILRGRGRGRVLPTR